MVPEQPALQLTAQPSLMRTRRHARFALQLTNSGNVALDVALEAADPERVLAIRCSPPRLTIAAGATVEPLVLVRSRRMMLGDDLDHPITVTATGAAISPVQPVESSWTVQRLALSTAAPLAVPEPIRIVPEIAPPAVDPEETAAGPEQEPPATGTTTLIFRQRAVLHPRAC